MTSKLPKKIPLLIALAAGTLMLVVGMLPTDAGAANPLKTSFPTLGSLSCTGSLNNSADPTDLPNGSFSALGAWIGSPKKTRHPNVLPISLKQSGPLQVVFGIYVNAACKSLDVYGMTGVGKLQNPCIQTIYGTGTYTVAKGASNGVASVSFSESPSLNGAPAQPPGTDPFDGCTASFNVYPFSNSRASIMTLAGPLTGTCSVGSGAKISILCQNNK